MENRENIEVKLVVFSVIEGKLSIFRTDSGLLPSSRLLKKEALDEAAKRIFAENTGMKADGNYLEQLYTVSAKEGIDVVYYVLVPDFSISGPNLSKWKEADESGKDPRDGEIEDYAVQRLRWKIEYTNAVYSLLPPEFTLSELQSGYEAILGKKLDKRNFRKKIQSLKLLKSARKVKKMGSARPAAMFSFKKRTLTYVRVL